jgi:hypothetical protein
MDDFPLLAEGATLVPGSPSLPGGFTARCMLWYIARVWLASKFGTRAVIIAGVMIGPHSLGVARRVKIRREGYPSLSLTMKRLSAKFAHSRLASPFSRPPRVRATNGSLGSAASPARASHKKYLNRRNLRDRYIRVGKDYVVT